MAYTLSKGIVPKGKKIVIYGQEGAGKTTLCSKFPEAVFIDTEGSTYNYDWITRYPQPLSWAALTSMAADFAESMPGKTLVIDSADWAEQLCIREICAQKGWDCIEQKSYGAGYKYLEDTFGRFLNDLNYLVDKGINVAFTAHCLVKNVNLPDQPESYDRYQLKLQTKTAALLKEWADAICFLTFEEFVVKGGKSEKAKATGGKKRMLRTVHNAAFDGKNRFQLPEEIELNGNEMSYFDPILTHQFGQVAPAPVAPVPAPQPQPVPQPTPAPVPAPAPVPEPTPSASPTQTQPTAPAQAPQEPAPQPQTPQTTGEYLGGPLKVPDWDAPEYAGVPDDVLQLMKADNIPADFIQWCMSPQGHVNAYPYGTPLSVFDRSLYDLMIKRWSDIKNWYLEEVEKQLLGGTNQ